MLDIKTILFTTFLVNSFLMLVLAAFWKSHRKDFSGIGFWAAGIAMNFVTYGLVISRLWIELWISVIFGNMAAVLGLSLITMGLQTFFETTVKWKIQVFFVALIVVLQSYFLWVEPSLYARILCLSGVVAPQCFYMAWTLQNDVDPKYRPLLRLTQWTYLILGFVFVWRAIGAVPMSADLGLFDGQFVYVASFLMIQILTISAVMSFLIMLYKKQRMELEASHWSLRVYRRELEFHREDLEKQVEEKSRQLYESEKLATVGTLSAGIAHEINNPNQAIALNLSHLQRFWGEICKLVPSQQMRQTKVGALTLQEFAQRMEQNLQQSIEASERIKRIANDLKDYASPHDQVKFEEVNLQQVIQSGLNFSRQFLQNHRCELSLDLPSEAILCQGKFHPLVQVVINLLQNACQAIHHDRGLICIRLRNESDGISLLIEDNGIGFDQRQLAQLTNPFFTTHRAQGGTGLGLYIVAKIIEEHGGRLDFHRLESHITQVQVYLPRSADASIQNYPH